MEHIKTIAVAFFAIFLAFLIDSFVGVSTWLAPKPAAA
jgi:hypothetical protein